MIKFMKNWFSTIWCVVAVFLCAITSEYSGDYKTAFVLMSILAVSLSIIIELYMMLMDKIEDKNDNIH